MSKKHGERLRCTAIALTLAMGIGAAVISGDICYALRVNGRTVGTARSMNLINAAVSEAEEEVSRLLGRDYTIDTQVATVFSPSTMDAVELKNEMMKSLPEVELLWAIEVDGEVVGACKTEAESRGIVDSILERYLQGAETAEFLQEVEIREEYLSCETLTDADEIRRLLDPENGESEHSLKVMTTRKEQEYRITGYETEYYDEPELYEGETQVTASGISQESIVTVKVEYLNGSEVSRTDIAVRSVVDTVPERVAVGTKPRPVTASYGEYIWPAEGVISSGFGYRSISIGSSNHKGIDIAGEADSDITAADGGEVICAGEQGGYGNLVQILHDDGTVTCYGHCSEIIAKEGERVARGQVIARMGTTGVSTGVHLHFEIRKDGEAVDPLKYLRE